MIRTLHRVKGAAALGARPDLDEDDDVQDDEPDGNTDH